jgi:PKD repeat protein
MEGTSTAAAHVSGVAALLIANENAVSPEQVRQALESTAEDKGQEGWDIRYGWGMVDAYAALQWTSSDSGPEPQPLEADFSAEPRLGTENTTVKFTNRSTGSFTSVLWDFGDGETSTQLNPTHTYLEARTYTVSLTVMGPGGSDTETRETYIRLFIPEIPSADFTREPISIDSPSTVHFIDTSTCRAIVINRVNGMLLTSTIESASHGGISTWTWDFGDGTTSNERNPSHTYKNAGSYTVSLTATGPGGSDTEIKEGYVQVSSPPPVASFTAIPTSGNSPLTVQFTETTGANITSFLWDFGDGSTSDERNPVHTYRKTGSYTVSLTVVNMGGSDTKTKDNYIQVTDAPPSANFAAVPKRGNSPLGVQFTDTSRGNITSRMWDFGDGTTSNERSPSHTYQNEGSYTVSLTVTGPGGSDTETRQSYIQVTPPAPSADFTATPRNGSSPLVVQFTDTSTGQASSRLWDFGDGKTSTEQHPTHTYTFENGGVFTVSLTVTGKGGTDTETKLHYIHLNSPPVQVNITLLKDDIFRNWYTATAVVSLKQTDKEGAPLAEATVEGTWSGGFRKTVSGVTDAGGRISFATDLVTKGDIITFTVNKVIAGGKGRDIAGTMTVSIEI